VKDWLPSKLKGTAKKEYWEVRELKAPEVEEHALRSYMNIQPFLNK